MMIKTSQVEQNLDMLGYTIVSVAADSAADTFIRLARLEDAQQIFELVNYGEREGQLLPRTLDAIQGSIGDWIVATSAGQIIGVGSLLEMGPTLVEVRSLAVAPAHRKIGVGAKIVEALVREAHARGIQTVFALTRAVPFFVKSGFSVTEKENFPEKVWRDCLICPVRLACDEVAVVRTMNSEQ
jgi:amino-acid N-acetyltransferase